MENNKGIPHDRTLFLSSAGHKSSHLLIETPAALPLRSPALIPTRLSSGDSINKLQMYRKSARSFGKVEEHGGSGERRRGSNTPLNIQFDYSLLGFLT